MYEISKSFKFHRVKTKWNLVLEQPTLVDEREREKLYMKRTTMLLLIVDVVLKKQESRVAALVLCPLCKSFTLYNVGSLVNL